MIVVTGGSGVLGHALVSALAKEGKDTRILSSAEIDLRDRDRTIAKIEDIKPDLIYHLAAKVHGLGGNTAFPAEMFADNVRINMNVIDGAHASGCSKIVAVSTVAIYSSDAERPVVEGAIWNGPPHKSEQAYGHAKRAMLAQLEAYATQYGIAYAYPIMTNIYGPHDRFDAVHGHVVPSLVAKFHAAATSGRPVEVWGTGRAERDFLFASDAADALLMIADRHEGPINVATGSTVPIRAVVEILSRHTGVTDVRWDETKPDGQLERSYDVSKLNALGFSPAMSIADGLRDTYDWYASAYPNVRS
jgi:GDP-L-fucose synthase